MDRQLSAEQFTLVEDARGLRKLAFTSKIKNDLDQIRSNTDLMRGPRLTCPALIDFGEGSAMQRLWYWHVAVGETLYQYLYPTKNPKPVT